MLVRPYCKGALLLISIALELVATKEALLLTAY